MTTKITKDILTAVKNMISGDPTNHIQDSLIESIRKYTGTGEWIDVSQSTKMSLELYLMACLRGHTEQLIETRISLGYTFLHVNSKELSFKVEYEKCDISTLKTVYDFLLHYYIRDEGGCS